MFPRSEALPVGRNVRVGDCAANGRIIGIFPEGIRMGADRIHSVTYCNGFSINTERAAVVA